MMDGLPQIPEEVDRDISEEEPGEGAPQDEPLVNGGLVVAMELEDDNASLSAMGITQIMDSVVGCVEKMVQDLEEVREEQEFHKMALAPASVEESCPICGGNGIFGVNNMWLYLAFSGLGFLMGYIAMVHGRG